MKKKESDTNFQNFPIVPTINPYHDKPFILLYSHVPYHNDTMIKTQEDFFNTIFTSLFIARVRKGLRKVCVWEGAGDQTELKYFDPHSYDRHVVSFSFFDAQPEVQRPTLLGDDFLYCILSASSLDPNSSGLLEGPFGRVWLSLPHLVYNSPSLLHHSVVAQWDHHLVPYYQP